MRDRIKSSRFAAATATIALVAALAGPSYGVVSEKVGSNQIKTNAVKTKHVANGSLLAEDFQAGQLPAGPAGPQGIQGPAGPQGLEGPAGPQGVEGPAGPASLPTLDYNTGPNVSVANGATEGTIVSCDPGMNVVGGGVVSSQSNMSVDSTYPGSSTTWEAIVRNDSGAAGFFKVFVICTSAAAITKPGFPDAAR